jgi:hypothetical protein
MILFYVELTRYCYCHLDNVVEIGSNSRLLFMLSYRFNSPRIPSDITICSYEII